MRSKTTAALLAFFLGGLGIHQFYLGNYFRGILFLLFSWTFIPIFIGVIDFLILLIMNEVNFNQKYNKVKISNQVTNAVNDDRLPSRKPVVLDNRNIQSPIRFKTFADQQDEYYKKNDSSIIDVNETVFELKITPSEVENTNNIKVPFWAHTYVYSIRALDNASEEQKEFYSYFKNQFKQNQFINIEGNTNYAFILYFDLLKEYDKHNDIELLERQFALLGQICPKTKNYSATAFKDLLRKRNDSFSVNKLNELSDSANQFDYAYGNYDPDEFKLGKQYKKKLKLNEQEVLWLNKFWNPTNVFISIEGCCVAVIKQYLLVLNFFDDFVTTNGTSFSKETDFLKKELKKFYRENTYSDFGYYQSDYFDQISDSAIYLTIFKKVENFVREKYGHKRKIKSDFGYTTDLDKEFESRIGELIDQLNLKYSDKIELPDLPTQLLLNAQNVNRWKNEFSEIKDRFNKSDIKSLISDVEALEEANQKNPNIEHIFYEASKFIAKYDKVQALQFYAKYIYYDLKSNKFDNKQLTRTIEKSLFKTEEQIAEYQSIIRKIIETGSIENVLDDIAKIYIPKRKKIILDKNEIRDVAKKHDSTVELLNEYLDDTEDGVRLNVRNTDSDGGVIEVVTITKQESPFNEVLNFNNVQLEILRMMKDESFIIAQNDVDKFALKNGIFKNQLIDSINEACYDLLEGEPLIEEDEENYIIEKSYYQELEIKV
ncbi:MAG TPA: tellurite resistance TerB C-terminal domain-containing protein [Aequorivita sp.]|nr:tellurite resistance TerB C-terminal domain-containing protein [Aequorivita sp.]